MTAAREFSFAEHAQEFDSHIGLSIPGYEQLVERATQISTRFVQHDSTVIDLGCSSGHLIEKVCRENSFSRRGVRYLGVDCERKFRVHWRNRKAKGLAFQVGDLRSFPFEGISYACSIFTLQFLAPSARLPLLGRLHASMLEGGAMVIAEKILADTGRMQDALTFPYYDFKRGNGFSAQAILDKERSLRGQMVLSTENELRCQLQQAGFRDIQQIWGSFPFLAFLVLK